MQTKVCTKCGEEKAFSKFCKDKRKKNGIGSQCKKCKSYTNKIYRENNKKKLSEYCKKYHEENKELIHKRKKEYRKKNKEKERKRKNKWYKENPEYYKKYRKENIEKIKAYKKKWQKENHEKSSSYKSKYRASKENNGGSFTAEEWKALKKKYDYKCICCGKKKKLEADHVIPVSKGGTSNIDNIQPLCRSCNSSKGNRSSADYR